MWQQVDCCYLAATKLGFTPTGGTNRQTRGPPGRLAPIDHNRSVQALPSDVSVVAPSVSVHALCICVRAWATFIPESGTSSHDVPSLSFSSRTYGPADGPARRASAACAKSTGDALRPQRLRRASGPPPKHLCDWCSHSDPVTINPRPASC